MRNINKVDLNLKLKFDKPTGRHRALKVIKPKLYMLVYMQNIMWWKSNTLSIMVAAA